MKNSSEDKILNTPKEVQRRLDKLVQTVIETDMYQGIFPIGIDTKNYLDIVFDYLSQKGVKLNREGSQIKISDTQENSQDNLNLAERIARMASKILKKEREHNDPTPYLEKTLVATRPLEKVKDIITRCNDISFFLKADYENRQYRNLLFFETFPQLEALYRNWEIDLRDKSSMKVPEHLKQELISRYDIQFMAIMKIAIDYVKTKSYHMDDKKRDYFIKEMKKEIEDKTDIVYPKSYKPLTEDEFLKWSINVDPTRIQAHIPAFSDRYGQLIKLAWNSHPNAGDAEVIFYFHHNGNEVQYPLTFTKGDLMPKDISILQELGKITGSDLSPNKNLR